MSGRSSGYLRLAAGAALGLVLVACERPLPEPVDTDEARLLQALDRCWSEHGRPPRSLEALVPEYLPAPPIASHCERGPQRYERDEDGWWLRCDCGVATRCWAPGKRTGYMLCFTF